MTVMETLMSGGGETLFITRRSIQTLSDGTVLVAAVENNAADVDNSSIRIWRSTDDGDTWSEVTQSGTDPLIETSTTPSATTVTYFNFFVDANDVVWLVGDYDQDSYASLGIWRGIYSSGTITWDAPYLPTDMFPGGVQDMVAFRVGTDDFVVNVQSSSFSTYSGLYIFKRTSGGTWSTHQTFLDSEDRASAIDFHHTGDGKTVQGGTPHIYHAYNKGTGYYCRKYTYSGGTWSNPGTGRLLWSLSQTNATTLGRFNGTDFFVAVNDPDSDTYVVKKRNAADTTTTNLGTVETNVTNAYRHLEIDLFFDKTGVPYFASTRWNPLTPREIAASKWAGGTTWEAEVDVSSLTPANYNPVSVLSSPTTLNYPPFVTVIDDNLYYFRDYISFNQAPTAPTWVTPTSGEAKDVALTLVLDWDFNDPDVGDTQSAFTLRKREGAGSYEYWTGSAWQSSEDATTKIASSATTTTLPASWGADPDEDHYYSVKTWDDDDTPLVGPWSSELRIIPSAASDPTLDLPADAGSVGGTASVEWTVSSQSAYRVVVSDTSSTVDMDAGTLEEDSGWVTDSGARTYLASFPTNTVTRYVRIQTKNSEGLLSAIDEHTVSVSYTPPSTPTLVVSEVVPGALRVAITNPAGATTTVSNDVYRRVGSGEWKRVAATVAPNGFYDDYRVAAGVTYDYKVIALGDNGATAEGT